MRIKVFATGGTFDKEYNELTSKLYFKDTHLPEMLKLGRCKLNIDLGTLMMIDSLDMTDKDRRTILDHCKKAKEDRIVITHGTDTVIETAKVLARGKIDKTIILIGAMVSYKFGSSDGLFNLGSALSFAQVLPSGVYIEMNGEYFLWNNVRKNKKLGNEYCSEI